MEAADRAGPEADGNGQRQQGRSRPVVADDEPAPEATAADNNGGQYPSESDDEAEEEEEDDEDEDEPRLKYGSLTKSVGGRYRNGDATSTFSLSGDKMVCSTVDLEAEFYGQFTESEL